MKQAILIIPLMAICSCLFAQRAPSDLKSKEYYLSQSRKQKLAAWPLMGAGITMATIGMYNWAFYSVIGRIESDYRRRSRIGALTAIAGGGAIAASLTLFSSAKRNKQRAADMNMYMERLPITGMASQPSEIIIPAVRITIQL